MKIGILTQPLISNYGGILQNYALQTILKREGFDPCTIQCAPIISNVTRVTSILKRCLLKYIFRRKIILRIFPTEKETAIMLQNIEPFMNKYIVQTKKYKKVILKKIKKYAFEAYIVGSDQVWRPQYSPYLTNYFLDFLVGNNEVKKIAYAASFGVDNWEFTTEQTKNCAALAKQFDAISVREDSAIELCKKYLDVDAIQVLDPTMLLKKEDYTDLVKQDNIPERENILFNYILDKSDEKNIIVETIIKESKLHPIYGALPYVFYLKKSKKDLSDCIFISVPEWIAGFRDAKFVMTDSFHGTVFSILFNKPFVVFANEDRGNTRLTSLLKMFNLEERLITSADFDKKLFYLDYYEINKILEKERDKSITYLLNALNSHRS